MQQRLQSRADFLLTTLKTSMAELPQLEGRVDAMEAVSPKVREKCREPHRRQFQKIMEKQQRECLCDMKESLLDIHICNIYLIHILWWGLKHGATSSPFFFRWEELAQSAMQWSPTLVADKQRARERLVREVQRRNVETHRLLQQNQAWQHEKHLALTRPELAEKGKRLSGQTCVFIPGKAKGRLSGVWCPSEPPAEVLRPRSTGSCGASWPCRSRRRCGRLSRT